MIGAFPDLYPDELLMSGWARYEAWICYAQRRALLEELLGNYKATVAFDLPGRLGYFVAALPPEHPAASIEKLVAEHTLFPFYAAFLSLERRTTICQQMCSDDGVNIHTWLGLSVVRHSLPTTLRYCPLCVDEDRERFGETYWHRIHQVAGVSVCSHHAVWLEDSTVAMWIIPGSVTFTTAESAVTPVAPRYLQVEEASGQQLLRIAQAVQWLLTHPQTSADTFNLKERCLLPLAEQGLASYSGRYQQGKILQAFQSIFPPELLSQIACDFPEYDTGASWLTRLLQKRDTTTFALYCLLLVLFLADDIPSFLALPSEWQPFGTGPWPCLNPTCEHDHKLSISKYEFDYNHKGLPRATFTCTVCGFVYSRIGPDTSDDDLYRIGAIKDHGALWHARLLKLWFDPDVTIRHMVAVLRSSWTHLRRQGTQLELPFPPPGVRSRRLTTSPITLETNNNLQCLTAQREAWLTVIQQHPDWSMNSLREHFSQLYSWLRYHDREWLLQQSPRQERKPRHLTVDWQQRDIEFVAEVKTTFEQLMSQQDSLFRVSATAILVAMRRRGYYSRNRHRLPQTMKTLQHLAESYEAFAIRRIWHVAHQFSTEGIVPRRRLLVEQAGVETFTQRNDPQVQAAVDDALNWLKGD